MDVIYRGYGQTPRQHLELKESLGNLSVAEAVRLKNMRELEADIKAREGRTKQTFDHLEEALRPGLEEVIRKAIAGEGP